MARRPTSKKSVISDASKKQEEERDVLMCARCNVEMQELDIAFKYLSRDFRYKVPRCPECGQVSLPEELVTGKMADVESLIESK